MSGEVENSIQKNGRSSKKQSLANIFFLYKNLALAGVAQWTEGWPVNQKVTGSILSQDKCLGLLARSPVETI